MSHKAWSEKPNYPCIEMTKNKNEAKYRIFNEGRTLYTDSTPETEPF